MNTELTNAQLLPRRKEVEEALEDYRVDRTLDVDKLAKDISTTRHQFLAMFKNYEEARMATAEHKQKAKKILTPSERMMVCEAKYKGGTQAEIARRFDISEATVGNIWFAKKEEYLNSIKKFVPVTEPEPVVEIIAIAKEENGTLVSFEGDYLVLKIPRKNLTRELLKGVL